jgi:hypothetical protein
MGFFDFLFPPVLGDATIRVLAPSAEAGRTIPVRFVLGTFKLEKTNKFIEVSTPGLNGQPLQFVHGQSRTLSMVLKFDGRATNTDARQPMHDVASLMRVDGDTHAPPVLSVEWTGFLLKCVLESSTMRKFSSSFSDGRPSRGQMHVTFKEFQTLEELLRELNRQ